MDSNAKIIEFISRYINLTDDEIQTINAQNFIQVYKKGTVLLKAGDFANDCFFVLQGCVRSYYITDGEEKTTEFYTENQSINPACYVTKEPSDFYLDCLEDSVIALGNEERSKALIERVPKLNTMIMQFSSLLLAENQNSLDDFKILNPEERYKKLLKSRPELFQRVPLYHIASYLGITPVSLSRLRKRILTHA
ncbi:Crp/Fnr family transcriptional regulator [bacterium]|nr:MAG: Crp/Fnr family transcriptional regulator [bacterium]